MLALFAIPAFVIAPAGILLYYFWVRDRWEKEPWSILWTLFGIGCLSVIPAALIEILFLGSDTLVDTVGQAFFVSFIGVALVEEGIKFACIYLFTWKSRYFREEYDGIIYAVALGLGFAFLENIFYVVMALVQGEGAIVTAAARAFTAVPAHALDGVIIGYYLGRSRFMDDPSKRLSTNLKGIFLAVMFHGLYDLFVFLMMVIPEKAHGWCIVGLVWTLIVQWGVAHRLIIKAQDASAARWRALSEESTLEIPSGARKFCRSCGNEVRPEARYCRKCGAELQ